ncbi:hypothetical protein Tsubulata_028811, partial [Turnera subulata]
MIPDRTPSSEWWDDYDDDYEDRNSYSKSGRINRTTKTGSWQAKGPGKPVCIEKTGKEIGRRKIYVHSMKRDGYKWVMHELSAAVSSPNQRTLVVCKVMKRPRTKGKRKYKNAGISSGDEAGASCNVNLDSEKQNSIKKTRYCTSSEDNSTYTEGEGDHLMAFTPQNYSADVTIPREIDPELPPLPESSVGYNQLDYGSFHVMESHMLTEQGLYYNGNGMHTLPVSEEDPFSAFEPLWMSIGMSLVTIGVGCIHQNGI